MRQGIDVSLWQTNLEWNSVVSQGYSFSIIKASEGLFRDPLFILNIENAKRFGVKNIGAYHFLKAATLDDAKAELKYFLSVLDEFKDYINYYVAVDVEANELPNDKNELTEIVRYFITGIRNEGYCPILYTNRDWLKNRLNNMSDIDLWLAAYTDEMPSLNTYKNMKIWQNGISKIGNAAVDHNWEIRPWIDSASWSRDSIEWCVENGIIKGDENGLRLKDNVTREEMCVFLKRLYDLR